MIEPRIIRTFVTVMALGSVSRAARARGYSAAAVSRQLTALQQRLGVVLFVKAGRSIKPTAAAWELEEQALRFLDEADRFDIYVQRVRAAPTALSAA